MKPKPDRRSPYEPRQLKRLPERVNVMRTAESNAYDASGLSKRLDAGIRRLPR